MKFFVYPKLNVKNSLACQQIKILQVSLMIQLNISH